jgi:hypothetical protein
MKAAITKNREDLKRLEAVIIANLKSFYDVGRALTEIRDRELYKINAGGEYQTFEAYCRGEWGISRPRAYQLIDAATVQENLSTIVDKQIPESQVRPLTRLKPEQQLGAWQMAVETSPGGKVTAAHISKVVRSMSGELSCKKQILEAVAPETAVSIAKSSLSQLERIKDDDPSIEKAFSVIENWIEQRRENIEMKKRQASATTNCALLEPDGQTIGI